MTYQGYGGYEAASLARKKAMAEALYARSLNDQGQPIQHATQGLAKLARAFFARQAMDEADTADQQFTTNRKAIADKMLSGAFPGAAAPTEAGPAFDLTPGAMEERQGENNLSAGVRNVADLTGDPMAAMQYGQGQQDRARQLKTDELTRQALKAKLTAPIEVSKGASLYDPQTRESVFTAPGDPAEPAPGGLVHSVVIDNKGVPHAVMRDASDRKLDFTAQDTLKSLDVGGVPYLYSGRGASAPAPVASAANVGGNQATIETVKDEEKARRDAQQGLPDLIAKVENTRNIVNQLITHEGFGSRYGFQGSYTPAIGGTPGAGAQALIDQVKGQAFLQAFESLKGAGQITEVEGNKATNAITRLTNQGLRQEEAVKAAREFIGIVDGGLARARAKAAGGQGGYRAPARVTTAEDYYALPKGATFIDPQTNKVRQKQ